MATVVKHGLGALLHNHKKDFDGAIREFRAILKIDPNHAGARRRCTSACEAS